jgi:hypothetical protein
MNRHFVNRKSLAGALLAGAAIAVCVTVWAERAAAFRGGGFGDFRGGFGGFRGGSFAGGRFGDGGFFDRSTDAGFGRGGWGSIHNAGAFSGRADTFAQNHPEWRQNASQFQQNRFNEANTLQANRYNDVGQLQNNRSGVYYEVVANPG